MSLKFLFHCLAVASGIIAGATALLSSNNRIILFIVFALIAAIFEITIPFLKTPPIDIPKPKYSFILFPSNYNPGLEVHGIKWEPDFKEYRFNFQNESLKFELEDLRIDLQMPGGIVTYAIEYQEGCEDISFSQQYTVGGIGDRKDKNISKTFDYYVNTLKINLVRLFPKGRFSIIMIIKFLNTESNGIFISKFRYSGKETEKKKKYLAYEILFKDKNTKSLYIDESKLISGEYKATFLMIPKKPLVFRKNGSVQIKD